MASRWSARSYGKSDYTPMKQQHLREIATMVLQAATQAQKKHGFYCDYLLCADLMAGPGIDDAGDSGSPLVLLETARKHADQAHLWFFESETRQAVRLVPALEPYRDSTTFPVQVFVEDCRTAFPRALERYGEVWPLKRMLGLIYADPTTEVPWDVLAYAARALPYVDILIYLPAVTPKRVCGVHGESDRHVRLANALGMVSKKTWLIRQLVGQHQWTFLLGTNYAQMKECRRIGLVRLDSPEGQNIWDRACLTTKEREAQGERGQLRLF